MTTQSPTHQLYGIAMVTEFFYPRCGGVEMHIMSISQELLKMGYHVIIITRYEGHYMGIQDLPNGLRVYYLPLENMTLGTIYPYFFIWMSLFRDILIKEHISIIHYHQCTSVMFHTSIREAEFLGLHTVYTDHSLMSLSSLSGITINQVLRCYSCSINAIICVSQADCANFCLRQRYTNCPSFVHIIPNAVETKRFLTNFSFHPLVVHIKKQLPVNAITIVILNRLVYRKGMFLLEEVIEHILTDYSYIHFIIGGNGDHYHRLETLADKWNKRSTKTRILLLGEIAYEDVPPFLSCGDIYLSCSLTESFNITILEAFVSGCKIVSTNVGGIPELLPHQKGIFVDPEVNAICDGLRIAISEVCNNTIHHPKLLTKEDQYILSVYDWKHVTERLLSVYDTILTLPKVTLCDQLHAFWNLGFGSFIILSIEYILLIVLNCVLDSIQFIKGLY